MQPGTFFPDDQAYIDFTDAFLESLAGLTPQQVTDILSEVVALCANPAGSHTLSNQMGGKQHLAGLNTVDVLQRQFRVVFRSVTERVESREVGRIVVLVCGPRRDDAVYDTASALIAAGRLSDDEVQEIWETLSFLDAVAEDVGLDGWDYRPDAAPPGMVRAAVAAGLLDEEVAANLSRDELEAAMAGGWSAEGPDPAKAVEAAGRRARGSVDGPDMTRVFKGRAADRCGAILKRTKQPCVRRAGHPGAHRATA